jgi:GH15 family glucan-1,4-alpha-glucosidase
MPSRIEDYALIGDCETAALVARDGSIDWLCWPRFDSPACFAALVGEDANGRWRIAPASAVVSISRHYRKDTLILETHYETEDGVVVITDFMPLRTKSSDIVRLVEGRSGRVRMAMELVLRFDYGAVTPWVSRAPDGALNIIAGPDSVTLRTPVDIEGRDMTTVADFEVKAGEIVPFVLSYGLSHLEPPKAIDARHALRKTQRYWRKWRRTRSDYGAYDEAVSRSLITLKALTHYQTGGMVAAPTTSLPEHFGGVRNWDYRYCWIRDATLLLIALMSAGHLGEAKAWTAWLHRAVAGSPQDMQIMYGVTGERRLTEWEADWLAGYEGAKPVRIGNAAHRQFQVDVYGELMDATHQARLNGLTDGDTWALQLEIMKQVVAVWNQPDEGIWEVRGAARHFTFSKVMAWVAVDRAVQDAEEFELEGPVAAWRALRDEIHAEVCAKALNPQTGGFQRAYDDPGADASLLLIADLGFVPADDPRFAATVEAVERELLAEDGLVRRYNTAGSDDGLPPGEGAFLPCSFWLADAYAILGRLEDGTRLFERLLSLRNEVGLLAEEYDPKGQRLAGNFPQALSHIGLINTALNLTHQSNPSQMRARRVGHSRAHRRA